MAAAVAAAVGNSAAAGIAAVGIGAVGLGVAVGMGAAVHTGAAVGIGVAAAGVVVDVHSLARYGPREVVAEGILGAGSLVVGIRFSERTFFGFLCGNKTTVQGL